MNDINGIELKDGHWVLYSNPNSAYLHFGIILKMNATTRKIWLIDTDSKKNTKYRRKYNKATGAYEATNMEYVSIINYLTPERFMIMP